MGSSPAILLMVFLTKSQLFQQIIGVLPAGGTISVAGHLQAALSGTGRHGGGEPVRLFRQGNMAQQHFGGLQDAGGIGIVPFPILDLPGGGAMDGLKHGVAAAQVGTAGGAYAALVRQG